MPFSKFLSAIALSLFVSSPALANSISTAAPTRTSAKKILKALKGKKFSNNLKTTVLAIQGDEVLLQLEVTPALLKGSITTVSSKKSRAAPGLLRGRLFAGSQITATEVEALLFNKVIATVLQTQGGDLYLINLSTQ